MPEITLVRQPAADLSEPDRERARALLFGMVDGLGEQGKKQWRRFWNRALRLEPGEIFTVHTKHKRQGPFHRRHMLIETRVFEAQERIASFADFRLWLKIGAGHVTWMAAPRGGVVPVPKSISYDELEEDDMRQFHENAIEFLRSEHAVRYLWPKLPAAQRAQAIEAVLSEFNE